MTTSKVEAEFDTVKDDLAKLRADVANLTAALKGMTAEAVHEQVGTIRDRLDRLTGDARHQGRQTLDELTDTIEERPLTSILVAFGAGIVLGRLLDR
jgi:ElaB/YqjD/DUF883 family membrane-anchored ribosome-binding protein